MGWQKASLIKDPSYMYRYMGRNEDIFITFFVY